MGVGECGWVWLGARFITAHNKHNSVLHSKTFNSNQVTKTSENQNSNFPGDKFIPPKKYARTKTIVDGNKDDNRFVHKNYFQNLTHDNNDLNVNYNAQNLDDKNITTRNRNNKRPNKVKDQNKNNHKRKVVFILGVIYY